MNEVKVNSTEALIRHLNELPNTLASPTYQACDFRKFIVHRDLYTGVFALLRKMNITSKSIYGDLNGLARSIKMEMQIYAT